MWLRFRRGPVRGNLKRARVRRCCVILHMTAIYENGVLRPVGHSPLLEGDRVEIVVIRPREVDPNSPEQIERRERIAKMVEEARAAAAQEGDDGYDLLKALDEHRPEGQKLYPPEMKGKTW